MSTGINTRGLRALVPTAELTIATGVITPTNMYHTVGAETGTTDDLDTINVSGYSDLVDGANNFASFIMLTAASGDTITVKHGTGNIEFNAGIDYDLSGNKQLLMFWNYDNSVWTDIVALSGAAGDVTGPASSTDNAIARFDGTTGKIIQNSGVSIDDSDNLVIPNSIQFDTSPSVSQVEGQLYYDVTNNTLTMDTDITGVKLQIGQEGFIRIINNTGSLIANGSILYTNGISGGIVQVALASAAAAATSSGILLMATSDIANTAEGFGTIYGRVRDLDTSSYAAGTILYLSDTAGEFTDTAPLNNKITIGQVVVQNASTGSIQFTLDRPTDTTYFEILNGMSDDQPDIQLAVDTGTVYFELQKTGGGDMVYIFDEIRYTLDCTTGAGTGGRARVALTEGTATAPQINYIYVTEAAGVLTLNASTTFPTGEFAWVGSATIQTDTQVTADGPLQIQRFDDALERDSRGALSHEREKLRIIGPEWYSGVAGSVTITTNPGSLDNVVLTTTSGVVYQMHRQTWPAYDISTDGVWVANASGAGTLTNYQKLTDLNSCLELSDGTALANNNRYVLTLWGAMNSVSEAKVFVNLPSGVYGSDNEAIADPNNTAITTVPAEFRTTAFLICKLVLRYTTAASGTIANVLGGTTVQDLRGIKPGFNVSGAAGGAVNEFLDSVFRINDDADETKQIAFQASGITTGTTRTATMPDADVTLGTDADAIHDNVAGEIAALTLVTAVSGDHVLIEDASDSNNKKRVAASDFLGGGGISIAIIADEKTSGTAGGTSSATTWNARDLNTEIYDPDGIVTISSNQFTPTSGDYEIYALAQSFRAAGNRIRLYNVTGTASVAEGSNAYGVDGSNDAGPLATLRYYFTANGTDAYRIDHYTTSGFSTTGLGQAVTTGASERYLTIILKKRG